VSTSALPLHRAPRPPALSRSTWRRVRRTLTAGVFLATTVAGVSIGLNGAAVSPVAPTITAAGPATGATPASGAASGTTSGSGATSGPGATPGIDGTPVGSGTPATDAGPALRGGRGPRR
jgi:hypothetical protein